MTTALDTFGVKAMSAAALARTMVGKLALDSADEDWILAESQVKQVGVFCRELSAAFKEHFADRLKERGDIEVGDGRRWYAAKVKETKPTMKGQEILEALMIEFGGDLDALKRCLSNGADTWKHSEIRELAPKLHGRLYKTEIVLKAKSTKPKLKPALTR